MIFAVIMECVRTLHAPVTDLPFWFAKNAIFGLRVFRASILLSGSPPQAQFSRVRFAITPFDSDYFTSRLFISINGVLFLSLV